MLVVPRKYAIYPFFVVASFIPSGQRLVIFTLDFFFLRIITLFAVLRIVIQQDYRGLKFGSMDQLFIVYNIFKTIVVTIQFQEQGPIIQQLGSVVDNLGMYAAFRCLVRDFNGLRALVSFVTILSIPTCLFFLVESSTGHNLFSSMGGVPPMTQVRDGKLRCQGAFGNFLIAGIFWGSFLPLIASQWFDPKKSKLLTLVGVGCSLIIILATNSSTSVMAILLGMIGASFYPLRRHMKSVRWAILFLMILIQLFVNGGLIYMIARANIFGSSTGWHRSYLMDRCLVYFFEWWLLGTQDTKHWAAGELGGMGLGDVTNHYIMEAVRGGLITMLLFIWFIVMTFSNIGKMMATREVSRDVAKSTLVWSLGVYLFLNVITFFSMTYTQQAGILIIFIFAATKSITDTVVEADRRERLLSLRQENRFRAE